MAIVPYANGPIASLVDVARALRPSKVVPSLAVGHLKPPHEINELPVFFGPHDEVKVVWHDAVGQQANARPNLSLSDYPQERTVIAIVLEKPDAADTSIEDVQNQSGSPMQLTAGHDGNSFKTAAIAIWPLFD